MEIISRQDPTEEGTDRKLNLWIYGSQARRKLISPLLDSHMQPVQSLLAQRAEKYLQQRLLSP